MESGPEGQQGTRQEKLEWVFRGGKLVQVPAAQLEILAAPFGGMGSFTKEDRNPAAPVVVVRFVCEKLTEEERLLIAAGHMECPPIKRAGEVRCVGCDAPPF